MSIENGAVAVSVDEVVSMSPPREGRSTDVSKLTFPLPMAIALVTAAIAIAAGVWQIQSQVSLITARIDHEREIRVEREKYLDARFAALEAKIEAAGLRNAAIAMSQELQKQKR